MKFNQQKQNGLEQSKRSIIHPPRLLFLNRTYFKRCGLNLLITEDLIACTVQILTLKSQILKIFCTCIYAWIGYDALEPPY